MSITPNVIMILNNDKKESFFCDICTFTLCTYKDFNKSREYGCCEECFMTFAEARRKEWKDGWRPNKTDIEAYIYKRKSMLNIQEKK